MDLPRLSKNVRRVTILNHDAATGAPMAVTVFKRGRKKKKSSRLLSPAEKVVRMYADVSDTATSTYLRRHKKSNRKRRDGWVRDTPSNLVDAGRKALKQIKPARALGL
jgi:uncharacterized protein DUF6312